MTTEEKLLLLSYGAWLSALPLGILLGMLPHYIEDKIKEEQKKPPEVQQENKEKRFGIVMFVISISLLSIVIFT